MLLLRYARHSAVPDPQRHPWAVQPAVADKQLSNVREGRIQRLSLICQEACKLKCLQGVTTSIRHVWVRLIMNCDSQRQIRSLPFRQGHNTSDAAAGRHIHAGSMHSGCLD